MDRFSERALTASLPQRADFAARLVEIDARVKKIITGLQTRGFKSPYLRNYVVARINPVRFHKAKKGETAPPMPLAQALTRMAAAARGFKSPYLRNYVVARINPVRFHKMKKGDTKPPMPIAQALMRMTAAVKGFKVESVSNADLAWVAVGAGD